MDYTVFLVLFVTTDLKSGKISPNWLRFFHFFQCLSVMIGAHVQYAIYGLLR
ncbi:hypothetical protein J2S23_000482 [Streptococcus moroccensis]|uniref:Uncharacterized protein n=1 Tax=Streptococcus moroccensis TaxID=1451356 RepID=A0ABT9YQS2_9STRE|nr:hypothetical protein [Streptococcus moroccensis]